jgi:hypothetical protein
MRAKGSLESGRPIFYLAYQTAYSLDDTALGWEIRAVWEQVREELDPSGYDYAFVEARIPRAERKAGEAAALRATYRSDDATWRVYGSDYVRILWLPPQ